MTDTPAGSRVIREPFPPVAAALRENPADGSLLALVAGGECLVGPDPVRAQVAPFFLALTPVTNAQYRRFITATGHRPPDQGDWSSPIWIRGEFPPEMADCPVACVGYQDAEAYCQWAGLRLPTSLEWEAAARGVDGRTFPWGNGWDPEKCWNAGNADGSPPQGVWTLPEGCSPWGMYNMAGNIWEWTADWHDGDLEERWRAGDFSRPDRGATHIVRGGSRLCRKPGDFACASLSRRVPEDRFDTLGFRCAADL